MVDKMNYMATRRVVGMNARALEQHSLSGRWNANVILLLSGWDSIEIVSIRSPAAPQFCSTASAMAPPPPSPVDAPAASASARKRGSRRSSVQSLSPLIVQDF